MNNQFPLTTWIICSKIETLTKLREAIKKKEFTEPEEFSDLMTACFTYAGLHIEELPPKIDLLQSSILTWTEGDQIPNELWNSITEEVLTALYHKIYRLKKELTELGS